MIISESKATSLGIGLHDRFQVRLETIYKQVQTAQFEVVSIIDGDNFFFANEVYVPIQTLKKMLNYQDHETESLKIALKNPFQTIKSANKLRQSFRPETAVISGNLMISNQSREVSIAGIEEVRRTEAQVIDENEIILSKSFKRFFQTSDIFEIRIPMKNAERVLLKEFQIVGFSDNIPDDSGLIHGSELKKIMIEYPEMKTDHPFMSDRYNDLVKEWVLLDKGQGAEVLEKRFKPLNSKEYEGSSVQINTMYETAGANLDYGYLMSGITAISAVVLFVLVMIGISNTLKMSLNERIREIGMLRAVGMQKKQVQAMFVFEYLLLSFLSSLFGIAAAFILMKISGLIPIDIKDNLLVDIILLDGKLYFVPSVYHILIIELSFLFLMFLITYISSNKAGKIQPSEALRTYQ